MKGKRRKIRIIDAFCGAGGFTLGFLASGHFDLAFANDFDGAALDTYRANFDPEASHSYAGDIEEVLNDKTVNVPDAEVVVGGPPCQGFSLLNKGRVGDPRRELWRPFLELVHRSGAYIFIMENVQQLLKSCELRDLIGMAREMGFEYIEGRKLCAADYGVPQLRYRAIVIASKIGRVGFPVRTHIPPEHYGRRSKEMELPYFTETVPDPATWRDVRSAIGDLADVPVTGTKIRRDLAPPLDLHFGRNPTDKSRDRYRAVPPGGNRFDLQRNRPDITPICWINKKSGGTDLFGRLWWDRPSVTIRTEFFKPEKGRYLHPELHRPITHREAARLQSFPDSFIFQGTKIQIARQIGNAVPPLMARAIAERVATALQARCQPRTSLPKPGTSRSISASKNA
jgi:DNA (cytosine-5)-methyltransferase 1